jgi:hypothetical protein
MTKRRFMSLPSMDTALVVLRVDSLTCAQALVAYRGVVSPLPDTLSPIVVRAGNFYVVGDPHARAGEWTDGVTFDTLWVKVKHFEY